MGFTRIFYNVMGWDYIGSYELEQINKQTRLKHLLHKELINTDLNKMLFKICCNKKNKLRRRLIPNNNIPMGILLKKGKLP